MAFDPWGDGGYCEFIHASWDDRRCDEVHDPNREREWGGEYGPCLIDRFTTGSAGRSTVCPTMSTWNPCQVVLMRTDLVLDGGWRWSDGRCRRRLGREPGNRF